MTDCPESDQTEERDWKSARLVMSAEIQAGCNPGLEVVHLDHSQEPLEHSQDWGSSPRDIQFPVLSPEA